VDSPFHRYADGKDLAALPLESLANLECVVARVPARHDRSISRLALAEADVRGRAVLVHTGWDRHWGTDQYFDGHPYLNAELAQWLVRAGVFSRRAAPASTPCAIRSRTR
jgi:kynurenine formamidase